MTWEDSSQEIKRDAEGLKAQLTIISERMAVVIGILVFLLVCSLVSIVLLSVKVMTQGEDIDNLSVTAADQVNKMGYRITNEKVDQAAVRAVERQLKEHEHAED